MTEWLFRAGLKSGRTRERGEGEGRGIELKKISALKLGTKEQLDSREIGLLRASEETGGGSTREQQGQGQGYYERKKQHEETTQRNRLCAQRHSKAEYESITTTRITSTEYFRGNEETMCALCKLGWRATAYELVVIFPYAGPEMAFHSTQLPVHRAGSTIRPSLRLKTPASGSKGEGARAKEWEGGNSRGRRRPWKERTGISTFLLRTGMSFRKTAWLDGQLRCQSTSSTGPL